MTDLTAFVAPLPPWRSPPPQTTTTTKTTTTKTTTTQSSRVQCSRPRRFCAASGCRHAPQAGATTRAQRAGRLAAAGDGAGDLDHHHHQQHHKYQDQEQGQESGGVAGSAEPSDVELAAASRILTDPVTQRTLSVLIEKVVPVEGVDYFVTTPRDRPVVIARVDDPQAPPVAMDERDLGQVPMQMATDALAEDGIKLVRSAFVLTVDESSAEEIEEDEDDDEEDEEDDQEEQSEKVELISSFALDGEQYLVVAPVDPILLIGKEPATEADMDTLVMPSDSELAKVQPFIEEAMAEDADDDDYGP